MPDAKKISVLDVEIEVPQPYAEGHTLSAIEARVLNQTFAENISNNVRSKIKKAQEGGEGAPTLDSVVAEAHTYAREYAFTEAAAGGGTRTLTPVEREARKLATAIVIQLLAKPSDAHPQGRKRKDISKEAFDGEVARIAATDKVVKLATKNVKDTANLASAMEAEEAAAA